MDLARINTELMSLRDTLDSLALEIVKATQKKDAINQLARQAEDKTKEILEKAEGSISPEEAMGYLDSLIELYDTSLQDVKTQARAMIGDKNLNAAQRGAMQVVERIEQGIYTRLTKKREVLNTILQSYNPEAYIAKQESIIDAKRQEAEEKIVCIKDMQRAKEENKRDLDTLRKLEDEINSIESEIIRLIPLRDGFPSGSDEYNEYQKQINKLTKNKQKKLRKQLKPCERIKASMTSGKYSSRVVDDYKDEVTDWDRPNCTNVEELLDFFDSKPNEYQTDFQDDLHEIEAAQTKIKQMQFAAKELGKPIVTTANQTTQATRTGNAQRTTTTTGRNEVGTREEVDLVKSLRLKAMPEGTLREEAYQKALKDKGARFKSKMLHPVLACRAILGKELVEEYKRSYVKKEPKVLTADQKDKARQAYAKGEKTFAQELWVGFKGQKTSEPVITTEMRVNATDKANTEVESKLR